MIRVETRATLDAGAVEIWRTIRDFNGLPAFVPLIASSSVEGEGVGAIRRLIFTDGHEAVETLEHLDDDAMTLRYSLVDSAERPFRGYVAQMFVRSLGERRCELTWSSSFEAQGGASEEEAREGPEGLYAQGIEGLRKLHEAD